MYGPEQAWIDKIWRPGEIELVGGGKSNRPPRAD
jgi:hypothetical protein